jgi:hypothetical protein
MIASARSQHCQVKRGRLDPAQGAASFQPPKSRALGASPMSQAVIDFCEGLKTTLLELEDRIGKAQASLAGGAVQVGGEARKHLQEASEQLEKFKAHAGLMAQAIRADLPEQTAEMREKLKEFGLEAQVAMRHAIVFLAETASKGAEGAASVLKEGAVKAKTLAVELRHDTAVTLVEPDVRPSTGASAPN